MIEVDSLLRDRIKSMREYKYLTIYDLSRHEQK